MSSGGIKKQEKALYTSSCQEAICGRKCSLLAQVTDWLGSSSIWYQLQTVSCLRFEWSAYEEQTLHLSVQKIAQQVAACAGLFVVLLADCVGGQVVM